MASWAVAQVKTQHISLANAAISNTTLPSRSRNLLPLPLLFPLGGGGGGGADMAEVEAATIAAAETPEVVAAAAAAEGAPAAKAPHKLHRQWAFWYDIQSKPKPGAAWGTSLRKAYTFDTVEEFWGLYDQIFRPSKVTVNADFHLFKAGVEPKWEDPECANGGKWTVPCSRKTTLENMWLETLMALIGEQFDESEEICGVVASVRQRGDKLALWTRTASNEAVQVNIGKKWKEIVDYNDKMVYSFHDDAKREKPSRGGRYNV